ncbi:tyrosine-sulfated glycopeptide receptor 1 [Phtheirospermum japonicum]|uniref:non-specific serine/threonine protein kinase n=1 Tax=Phtheirospermum japonicum TaxID=374723 RepID=A0A830BUU9_9LAMI|nr:tyrosine-sulfated glycopeptide receptor 1 [Phtheirospermum japonicum]
MINIHRFSNLFLKITLISISCFIHTCHGACNPLDRDSLSSFNLSLSSSPRLDWSLSVDCCDWEGITCDGGSGRVTNLWLPSRGLVGSISPYILNLTSLTQLSLSHNSLSGPLPARFFKSLNQLQVIDLSCNRLIGELNSSDTLPAKVQIFNFSSNQFHGPIQTPFIETGLNLETFDINNNSFSGTIPSVICSFSPSIKLLDFSNNDLTGLILPGFSQCTNLLSLRAGFNNLSGSVPHDIYGLLPLEELYLPGNRLAGPIDPSLLNLTNLKSLALFGNELTGPIPKEIGNLFKLEQLQLHINHLNGTIPNSLSNCTNLTLLNLRVNLLGGELSSYNQISYLPLALFLGNNSISGPIPAEIGQLKYIIWLDLSKNNFSGKIPANIIGCGGFGMVFKATLSDGSNVAIKKLSGNTGLMEREFKAEVEALSTAQHKNIVTLLGYCFHDGYRLLIYSYMENGSLDYWLHERPDGPYSLNWPARLKIARGASDGVAYMHETCEPHIVHRDLKSSNILLDRDFEAHVADFGLARLIMPYDTHVSTELVGTLGYIPPEYNHSWMVTLRGDMYSFGVVMLELLTGKRPVEVFKARMSRDLVMWVQEMRNEGKGDEIFDPILRGKGFQDEMTRVLDVACMCVSQNPLDRPTIKEVVEWLKNVGPDRRTT